MDLASQIKYSVSECVRSHVRARRDLYHDIAPRALLNASALTEFLRDILACDEGGVFRYTINDRLLRFVCLVAPRKASGGETNSFEFPLFNCNAANAAAQSDLILLTYVVIIAVADLFGFDECEVRSMLVVSQNRAGNEIS